MATEIRGPATRNKEGRNQMFEQFVDRLPEQTGLKVFIVVRQWAGGRRDLLKAFRSEAAARKFAGENIGKDDPQNLSAVSLQTVSYDDTLEPTA